MQRLPASLNRSSDDIEGPPLSLIRGPTLCLIRGNTDSLYLTLFYYLQLQVFFVFPVTEFRRSAQNVLRLQYNILNITFKFGQYLIQSFISHGSSIFYEQQLSCLKIIAIQLINGVYRLYISVHTYISIYGITLKVLIK